MYFRISKHEYQIETWIITFVNFPSFLTTKWGIQDINWFCLLKLSRNKLKSVEEMNEYFFSFCLITRVDGEKMWLTHPNNVIIEDTSMFWGDDTFCSQLQKNRVLRYYFTKSIYIIFSIGILRALIYFDHIRIK